MLLSAATSVTTVANATNSEIEHPVKSLYKDRECSVPATKMNRQGLALDHYHWALAARAEIGMTKIQFKTAWDRALHNWEFVEENIGAENFQNYLEAVYYPICKLSRENT